jgi:hypothetical protein
MNVVVSAEGPLGAAVVAGYVASGDTVTLVVSPPWTDPELPCWADPTDPDPTRVAAERLGLRWADRHLFEPSQMPVGSDLLVVVGDPPRGVSEAAGLTRLGLVTSRLAGQLPNDGKVT